MRNRIQLSQMENLIFTIGMIVLLCGISAQDIRSHTIPDRRNICLLIWVLAGRAICPVSLREGIIAAAGMLLLVLAADLLCLRLRGIPVMGGGDLKLLCIASLALGFGGACITLAAAVMLTTVWIGIRTVTARLAGRPGYCLRGRIPFAPFLSAGFAISWSIS